MNGGKLTRCYPDSGTCVHLLYNIAKLKGIKIASLNINGLLKHIDELRIVLAEYTFAILAINKSKIDCSISNDELHIIGYNVV